MIVRLCAVSVPAVLPDLTAFSFPLSKESPRAKKEVCGGQKPTRVGENSIGTHKVR